MPARSQEFLAGFFGSASGFRLAKPIASIAASPLGNGYSLAASDGGVFSFNVPFEGSLTGKGIADVAGFALTTVPLISRFLDTSTSVPAHSYAGSTGRDLGAVSTWLMVRHSTGVRS